MLKSLLKYYDITARMLYTSQPLSVRQEMIEMHRVREVMPHMPVCHPAFQPDTAHCTVSLPAQHKTGMNATPICNVSSFTLSSKYKPP